MNYMPRSRQRGAVRRMAANARARRNVERRKGGGTDVKRWEASRPASRNLGFSEPDAADCRPAGVHAAGPFADSRFARGRSALSPQGHRRHNVRASLRMRRRGVATLDYALLIGIVLPLAAFVLVIAPRIMLRVYEMISTMVSWPFM